MSDNDFEKSIEDLHNSAERITKGLEGVVKVIDTIAENNESFIKAPATAPESAEGDAIRDLLQSIRSQIKDIVDHGRHFETKLVDYSTEIGEITRQLEQTKKAAMLDPTTGIGNRRRFEESLARILGDLETFNNKVAVMLADVDKFKDINDTLGHHVGDQVLRQVAETFVTNLKGGDVVARWGGDEFAAILPATGLDDAMSVAENVRGALGAKSIKNKDTGETMGKVTLSIGVAAHRQGDNAHKLIFRADQALYDAKRRGRNRTEPEQD